MKELTKYYIYIVHNGVVRYNGPSNSTDMVNSIKSAKLFNHRKDVLTRIDRLQKYFVGHKNKGILIGYKEFGFDIPEPVIDFETREINEEDFHI